MATQAHRELEDAYTDLTTQAATIESMANAQSDPESYEAYQNYANALKNQATELATNGLTPASRSALLNMRQRYAKEVLPIQDAYNRRDKQAKLQAEILAKDPTHIFGRMASTTSLVRIQESSLGMWMKRFIEPSSLYGSAIGLIDSTP